jgi:hypothetical protein
MDIQQEVYYILGQRLLNEFDSKTMVEWAVNAMQAGYDSESLAILAGSDHDTTEEREIYFWKSVQELNINTTREESLLINDYAEYVAKSVINNQITPASGLRKMLNICISYGYDSRYMPFYEIDEDLGYIRWDGSSPIFNTGITLDNADDFIRQACQRFIEGYTYTR